MTKKKYEIVDIPLGRTYSEKNVLAFKVYLSNPKVLLAVQKMRKKWNVPIKIDDKIQIIPFDPPLIESNPYITDPSSLKDITKQIIKAAKKKKIVFNEDDIKFSDEAEEIMVDCRIPRKFSDVFTNFIKTGNIYLNNFSLIHESTIDVFGFEKSDGSTGVAIEIEPETTINEIVEKWHVIEECRIKQLGYNPQKQAYRGSPDRDLRIIQLKTAGHKPKEIVKKINNEFSKKISYTQVSRVSNSLKNRLNLNKKPLYPPK